MSSKYPTAMSHLRFLVFAFQVLYELTNGEAFVQRAQPRARRRREHGCVDKRAWMGEGSTAGRPVAFKLNVRATHVPDYRASFGPSLLRCS